MSETGTIKARKPKLSMTVFVAFGTQQGMCQSWIGISSAHKFKFWYVVALGEAFSAIVWFSWVDTRRGLNINHANCRDCPRTVFSR